MKYLREFQTRSEYDSFIASTVDYPNVCLIAEDDTVAFNPAPPPLYIEAIEDLAVKFNNTYEYSKDNVTWTSATSSTSISAVAGERVFFRASGMTASSTSGIGSFTISNGDCNVGGNIMSMVYGADFKGKTEITGQWQFNRLFAVGSKTSSYVNNMRIVDASNLFLPATTLSDYCYHDMFLNQQKLTNAPNLPATSLASRCYEGMFEGCTSLVNAPNLPATNLAEGCYSGMFSDCTSLINAPKLPAPKLYRYSYQAMFYGCTSLVNASELPATTLAFSCYASMFYGCTSLVNAPELPAMNVGEYSYQAMFYGCTSLVNAPELPATTLTFAKKCYNRMFYGCTSLVNAPNLPATSLASRCYEGMFEGCTSLVNAPNLPATNLIDSCYDRMFYGCSSLQYIKAVFTSTPSSSYTSGWVSGVSASGTFVKNSAATWENTFGVDAIPSGWTVELADA